MPGCVLHLTWLAWKLHNREWGGTWLYEARIKNRNSSNGTGGIISKDIESEISSFCARFQDANIFLKIWKFASHQYIRLVKQRRRQLKQYSASRLNDGSIRAHQEDTKFELKKTTRLLPQVLLHRHLLEQHHLGCALMQPEASYQALLIIFMNSI